MLILTRRLGEAINIGDDIKIQVLEIKGKQVRIGIQAPQKYAIHREEIYERIQNEIKNPGNLGGSLSLKSITGIWKKKINKN